MISREEFLKSIEQTDLIYNDLDLYIFTSDHLQNLNTLEENKEAFLKYIENEV
jgi:adenylosuccinate synthase